MTDREPRTILRAEATLLRLPIFGLAVKGSALLDGFEFRRAGKSDADELVFRTERDGASPYPGPLSRRLHMALLQIVAEKGFPFENPVTFSWRDLCKRMGLPNSGRRIGEFKSALRATWGLKMFGLSDLEGGCDPFPWRRLYDDCRFANERFEWDEGGEISGKTTEFGSPWNRIWLAKWYLESLNALHSAPVDYVLWKRLEAVGPLASRLYEFLLPTFYKRESVEIAYERLARAMPVAPQTRPSHAARQFGDALEALQREEVLRSSTWGTMKSTGRPKIALVRGALLDPKASAKAKTDDLSSTLIVASADGPREVSRFVVEQFAVEFYKLLGKSHQPYKSDLAVAAGLLRQYGEEQAFEVLPEAVKRLKARFRNAETLGPLARYFEETAAEAVRRREETQIAQQVAIERAAQRARDEAADRALREAWSGLAEAARAAIRDEVLKEHPSFRRIPSLVDAACLQKLRMRLDSPRLPSTGTESA